MAFKKKSAKKDAVLPEASQSEEERRPPVTQVVEVVEDSDESTHTAMAEPTSSRETLEEAATGNESQAAAPGEEEIAPQEESSDTSESDDQKRRVLVDELFQKKPSRDSGVVPEISMHHKASRRSPIVVWAIVLVVASLVAGGIILAVSGKAGNILSSIMATPTPTPTSSPTPTPTPDVSQLDRSTLSVQVLNGSGVVGAAGKMKDVLEEKGYTVENTGNAETYDYETTQIFVKRESEAFLALLTEDLQESYALGTSEATLEKDVPYDVRIIVGNE